MSTPRALSPEDAFVEFIALREAGEGVDVDSFCDRYPDFADDLRALLAGWERIDGALRRAGTSLTFHPAPGPLPAPLAGDPETTPSGELVRRLETSTDRFGRYRVRGEIGRGGMGSVLAVWDEDLRRELAMKVVLPGAYGAVGERRLARFVEEAQVTGQLDHPGIVPIHDVGLDDEGRLFFTMKLVKGRTLAEVFDLLHAGEEDWTHARAVGLLLRVCEAMAYAHERGVVHRDLKPGNVMVGCFGEVFVMDWGLLRILGRDDAKDVRIRESDDVTSERREAAATDPDSPLVTLDGDVVGTPAYMSPEQAAGEVDEVGPRSDVYAVGAMLYHLLSGQAPFVRPGTVARHYEIWRRVQEGPPRRVHELAPDAPAELVAICERAMERDLDRRYASMNELRVDLEAYVDGRVVSAYRTGALAELSTWVGRNRALAIALGAAVVLLVGGFATSSAFFVEAKAKEKLASERKEDVLSLSAFQDLERLVERADELWPLRHELASDCNQWLLDAHGLLAGRDGHLARLAWLRANHGREVDGEWVFEDEGHRWWHRELNSLVRALTDFGHRASGLVEGSSFLHGLGVARRRELAAESWEHSLHTELARARWDAAIRSIADRDVCPRYGGLVVEPEEGLLPLRRDPDSGLWEFAFLPTGDAPSWDGDTPGYSIERGDALVLVLIPGGTFLMGVQPENRAREDLHPMLRREEDARELSLDPYFLSKYEMTQDQWERLHGENPSHTSAGFIWGRGMVNRLHPVESVTREECALALARYGLVLPTEAQWEYAARAGTTTPWSTGPDAGSLEGAANLADATCRESGGYAFLEFVDWADGHFMHAPSGSFHPNGNGLHDVHGNVWEWCLDQLGSHLLEIRAGTGEHVYTSTVNCTSRGGAYGSSPHLCRSAFSSYRYRDSAFPDVGVRPARALAK